jgi:hypothetical protein
MTIVAEEYKILAYLPFADPETEAITRMAAALGAPVSRGPEGAPEINTAELLIYGFVPDDVDRQAATDLYGLDSNLTLVFTDPVDEQLTGGPVAQSMMKLAQTLAALDGARGVIVADYTADAIILRFQNGQVTLNQGWDGWQTLPGVLETIPEPRTMAHLQGRN